MNDDENTSGLSAMRNGPQSVGESVRISSMRESRQAIDQIMSSAQKLIRVFERDLSDPGYKDPTRIQLLETFLLKSHHNRIQIVLHDTQNLDRDCARLIALFRRHPNAFSIHHTIDAAKQAADSLVIADSHSAWHRLHHDHPHAVYINGENANVTQLVQRFNEIWESSLLAVSATTVGL